MQGAYGVHNVLREVQDIMERLGRRRLLAHTRAVSTSAWRPGGSFKGSHGAAMQRCTRLCRTAGAGCAAAASPAASSKRRAQEYARIMAVFPEPGTCGKRPNPLNAHEDCCKAGLRRGVQALVIAHVRSGCSEVERVHSASQDSQAMFASGSRRLVSLVADAPTPFHRYTLRQLTEERAARLKARLALLW